MGDEFTKAELIEALDDAERDLKAMTGQRQGAYTKLTNKTLELDMALGREDDLGAENERLREALRKSELLSESRQDTIAGERARIEPYQKAAAILREEAEQLRGELVGKAEVIEKLTDEAVDLETERDEWRESLDTSEAELKTLRKKSEAAFVVESELLSTVFAQARALGVLSEPAKTPKTVE